MLCSKVVPVCLLGLLALVNGMAENNPGTSEALPFIQFTDGGIRFNFAGYHAQAGLGGLLSGSQTGGGLHASAGAPWGAHASAGLGGILGGNNANAGGGLYARAGLGNGRHEAAAGLGGLLDGSGRSGAGARGGLFAGATTGTHGVGVSAGTTSVPSSGQDGPNNGNPGDDGGKPGKGRSNIQIIRKKEKVKQVVNTVPGSSEVLTPALSDAPAHKEIREAQSVQLIPAVEKAPSAPPLLNEANEVVHVDNLPTRVRVIRPGRKRFWTPRKQVILEYEPSSVERQDVVHSNTQKRQTITYSDPAQSSRSSAGAKDSNSFFDDVFNIPVSTLNAVNQLLNNNSG